MSVIVLSLSYKKLRSLTTKILQLPYFSHTWIPSAHIRFGHCICFMWECLHHMTFNVLPTLAVESLASLPCFQEHQRARQLYTVSGFYATCFLWTPSSLCSKHIPYLYSIWLVPISLKIIQASSPYPGIISSCLHSFSPCSCI